MRKVLLILALALLIPYSNIAAQPRSGGRGFPVAKVVAEKATLKEAPSNESATVMTVYQGMMFPVDGQTGDWYRVVIRSGGQAWIPKNMLGMVEDVVPERPAANDFTYEPDRDKGMNAAQSSSVEERLAAAEARLSRLEDAVKNLQGGKDR